MSRRDRAACLMALAVLRMSTEDGEAWIANSNAHDVLSHACSGPLNGLVADALDKGFV